jgi:hypothetical protein
VAKGGELRERTLVQAHLNSGENLGGGRRWCFATTSTAKNPPLDARTVGKHRQDQVPVTEGMVVEDKGVVVKEGHQDMVTESSPNHPPPDARS